MKSAASITCMLLCMAVSLQAQTLFSYGPEQVSKAEFIRAFAKNSNLQQPAEKDYRDYLQLYIRYKLKVKAAYDMRLDTLPNQIAEGNEFRKQLAESFMNEDTSIQLLTREAFVRSQKDIHLAHIFIPLNAENPGEPADTVKAFTLAMNAFMELQRGTDFGNVAALYSADSSVRTNKGDIGYITVFTLPYTLENIAYTTPAGAFSKPFRTRAGYHIFKNLGERKAAGRIKVAQILFAFSPGAGNGVKEAIRQKADSVYQALQKGAAFATLAASYSSDNLSYLSGGQLEEFGVGQYIAAFENAAFALPANGAVSKPVLTEYGYHILQRIEHYPVNTDTGNQEAMARLKSQVLNDARIESSRQAMVKRLYRITGLRKAPVNEKHLWAYADSAFQGKKLPALPGISGKTALFSFPKQQVTVADWLHYLQTVRGIPEITRGKHLSALLQQYQDMQVKEYYERHLEDYNSTFSAQLQEFKDGNLLFEMMQRNVWDKAAADTAGLMQYFNSNADKYWWQLSADALVFTAADSATAYQVQRSIAKNGKDWRRIIAPSVEKVQADSGRFEFGQLPVRPNGSVSAGMVTEPVKMNADNHAFSFAYIIKVYAERSARTFEEARGLALNDYQNQLEDQLVRNLLQKYPVKVNESVLRSLWE